MQCADCERLWKLYDHRRKIYVDLIRGAKWGTRYLKDALERANTERQDTREQYLKHIATHRSEVLFSGPAS